MNIDHCSYLHATRLGNKQKETENCAAANKIKCPSSGTAIETSAPNGAKCCTSCRINQVSIGWHSSASGPCATHYRMAPTGPESKGSGRSGTLIRQTR